MGEREGWCEGWCEGWREGWCEREVWCEVDWCEVDRCEDGSSDDGGGEVRTALRGVVVQLDWLALCDVGDVRYPAVDRGIEGRSVGEVGAAADGDEKGGDRRVGVSCGFEGRY